MESIVFEDGNVRIDQRSGVYGNSPFTVHTGGCGEPGEYMQVSSTFLLDYPAMADVFGPPGQVFVHEWAKYRYGVFEEFGYPGDEKYPLFYFKAEWSASGQQNVITPNFCTNNGISDFGMIDAVSGGPCGYIEDTGLPDENCIPVLGPNNQIDSSIMALPYIENNDQFCDDTEELFHRADIPTKHNEICQGRSTFSVILDHPDFNNYQKRNQTEEDLTPTFKILGTKDASSFVMVLDVSGSMDDNCNLQGQKDCQLRIDRMKQASQRWIEFDVKDGTPVGLVTFSSLDMIKEVLALKPIDDGYRAEFKSELGNITANGGTCMGNGLKQGIDTLQKGNVSTGGIIIFLTDGQFSCDNGLTLAQVIPDLKTQGARVITIAFSNNADASIIDLAKETDGKAYFVPDSSGPEEINSAMQGSLTYQPSVPSNEVDIIIYEESFTSQSSIYFDFIVDKMIGLNVTVQIDMTENNSGSVITINNDEPIDFNVVDGVYKYVFEGNLTEGNYNGKIESKDGAPISFVSIKVTGKANSATVPIMTECWTNFGTNAVDFANPNLKIAVIAKVMQGTNPVIGARVTAYIENEGADAPIEISLFDAGADPDSIANDGLYARYFIDFNQNTADTTRYTLKCQVEGTGDSQINQGFIDARSASRALPSRPTKDTPMCCGSNTLRDDSILEPTGNFRRSSAGGSIEIVNADKAVIPPGTVKDLRSSNTQNLRYFFLHFTSVGSKLDQGKADSFKIFYSRNSSAFDDLENLPINCTILTEADVVNPLSLTPQESGSLIVVVVNRDSGKFSDNQQYFFRLVTIVGTRHTWSNVARVYFSPMINQEQEESYDESLTAGAIAGIVIGSVATVFVVAAAVFFYKKKYGSKNANISSNG